MNTKGFFAMIFILLLISGCFCIAVMELLHHRYHNAIIWTIGSFGFTRFVIRL